MQEDEPKFTVVERKFAIQFLFKSKHDANKFKLPKQYKNKFVLNNNLDQDRSTYIRIAQIK